MKTNPSETIVQSAENAIMNAARALIGVVRRVERNEKHRATKIVHLPFQADWHRHGRAAGPLRNQRMLDVGKPDLVVAFPGGKGTADMVRRARLAGVEVVEVLGREGTVL